MSYLFNLDLPETFKNLSPNLKSYLSPVNVNMPSGDEPTDLESSPLILKNEQYETDSESIPSDNVEHLEFSSSVLTNTTEFNSIPKCNVRKYSVKNDDGYLDADLQIFDGKEVADRPRNPNNDSKECSSTDNDVTTTPTDSSCSWDFSMSGNNRHRHYEETMLEFDNVMQDLNLCKSDDKLGRDFTQSATVAESVRTTPTPLTPHNTRANTIVPQTLSDLQAQRRTPGSESDYPPPHPLNRQSVLPPPVKTVPSGLQAPPPTIVSEYETPKRNLKSGQQTPRPHKTPEQNLEFKIASERHRHLSKHITIQKVRARLPSGTATRQRKESIKDPQVRKKSSVKTSPSPDRPTRASDEEREYQEARCRENVQKVVFDQCARIIGQLMGEFTAKYDRRSGRRELVSHRGQGCSKTGQCGGYTPGGCAKQTMLGKGSLFRPVENPYNYDNDLRCSPRYMVKTSGGQFALTTKLLGEITYQLERRVLDYVFGQKYKKTRIARGHVMANLMFLVEMAGRLDWDLNKTQERYIRLKKILVVLENLGYDIMHHPEACRKIVDKYGVFSPFPDTTTVNELGLDQPQIIFTHVNRMAENKAEKRCLKAIITCLSFFSECDGKPIFIPHTGCAAM